MRRRRGNKTRAHPAKEAYERIHTDINTPSTRGIGAMGYKKIITFTDEWTRTTKVYFIKSETEALACFKIYEQWVNIQRNKRIKELQADGGGVYIEGAFQSYLASRGIKFLKTNRDEPSQNGISERVGGTIVDAGMSMLKHAHHQPESDWPYAIECAEDVYNLLPKEGLGGRSPSEMDTGTKSDLSSLRTFGCDALVRVPDKKKRNGADKAELCSFLGYVKGSKPGWRFRTKDSRTIITSGDATFFEGDWLPQGIQRLTNTLDAPKHVRWTTDEETTEEESSDSDDSDGDEDSDEDVNNEQDDILIQDDEPHNEGPSHDDDSSPESEDEDHHDGPKSPTGPDNSSLCGYWAPDRENPQRWQPSKAQRSRRKTTNYNRNYSAQLMMTTDEEGDTTMPLTATDHDEVDFTETPLTLEKAMRGDNAAQWKAAMAAEMESHKTNGTWESEVTTRLPPGKKCVGTKWIFKVKRDERGNVERYKARLVALGYRQRKGHDYTETFAPVLQTSLLRSLLALSAEEDWEVEHVDVKTAFLYGDIDVEMYVKLPNGLMHRLTKGLYGIKQAGRLWNKKLNETLLSLGFKRCDSDPCCYTMDKSLTPLILIVHVDDCLIFGPDKDQISRLKHDLGLKFSIKDLGAVKHALGWEIRRDRKKRMLTISQQQYTLDVLKRFGMSKEKPASTPACPNTTYSKAQSPSTDEGTKAMETIPYLKVLGSLLYLAVCTRPDIAYAVSELSKFASNPGMEHWNGLKRVMQYLIGTTGLGPSYGHRPQGKELHGFADASYGRCMDSRRSRYGGVYLINNGPVDWKSKMTQIVALSSMEAEYIGACEFTRVGVWLRRCLDELGFIQDQATKLGCDNKSAITFANEAMIQNRSKHIDTRYHYIREKIADKSISIFYQPTNEMPADMLTKPLQVGPFNKCRTAMGIIEVAEDRD